MLREIFLVFYKLANSFADRAYFKICTFYMKCLFEFHDVRYNKFLSIGLAYLDIGQDSLCKFGPNFIMINSPKFATLGKNNRCKIRVQNGAELVIGNNVGMSNCTIVATISITLGNNIIIGGGVTIIDSDFHSLNPDHWHTDLDEFNMKRKPIKIGDNVFIGMNAIILKGVSIGSNSIISAGSVLFSSVPSNEVWGGNPAKFIKRN